jgi:hypothetical protein
VLGAVVRCTAIVVPVAVAVVVAVLVTRALPTTTTWSGRVAWWGAVLGMSTLALVLADHAARRLLPLAVLLDLALVFPGRAPSRLRSARSISVRQLEAKLVALRAEGASGRPIDAAETLVTLVGILGLHDRRTRGHSERVRAFTDLLTDELGLHEDARVRIRWAALVHDMGKLSVPGEVLNAGPDLGEDAWAVLRRHPHEGRRLAGGLMPWLGEWGTAIEQHHERWDGAGYPEGLAGENIGYGARIVAVADAFDTMTSARSYNKARSAAAAREELARCAGAQFDPAVVRAFLAVSLPRLSWVLGPVTWLAQLPFVAAADRAGRAVKAGVTATAVSGLVVAGVLSGPGARPALSPAPPALLAEAGSTGTGSEPPAARPGDEPPAALPFTDEDSPGPARPGGVITTGPTPTSTPHSARPLPVPAPAPSPTVPGAPPVVARPVATPPVVPSPVVPRPVVTPPVTPPTATPSSPRPTPAKTPPGKRHGNGKGNGHFGANNASHADRWAR